MESLPLKQQIALVVDTMGMKGPVSIRDAAEEVERTTTADYWSLTDERNAHLIYISRQIKGYMSEPMGVDAASHIQVPPEIRVFLAKITKYICITEGGGRGALHALSCRATAEDWMANAGLKDFVAKKTADSRDTSRNIGDLLKQYGVTCLDDLKGE